MPHVFTFAEIHAGHVPGRDSFSEVAEEVRQLLSRSPAVAGGLLFGSVLTGSHTKCSDLDCVVAYESADEHDCLDVVRKLIGMARKKRVPLEPIMLNITLARQGIHTIGRSFALHFEEAVAQQGVIKQNPLRWIKLEHCPTLRHDVEQYLVRKYAWLMKQIVLLPLPDPMRFQFYEKILGLAPHVCRKVLRLHSIPYQSGAKPEVLHAYLQSAPLTLRTPLQSLLEGEQGYLREVERQMDRPDAKKYTLALLKIDGLARDAARFARLNAQFLDSFAHSL